MGTGRAELNVFPVLLIETLFVWMRGKPIRDLHLLHCDTGDLAFAGVAKPGQRDPLIRGSWKRRPEAPVP